MLKFFLKKKVKKYFNKINLKKNLEPSLTQHHGRPQTPREAYDCQKEDQKVH